MKLFFLVKNLKYFLKNAAEGTFDVLILPFKSLPDVNYKREIEGEDGSLRFVCDLSKDLNCVIIAGVQTDNYGMIRRSVIVADSGSLTGVSDMVHAVMPDRFAAGGGFRVYDTSKGKIGIIVDEDMYFPEVPRILTLCGSEILISVAENLNYDMCNVLARAYSFTNGIPCVVNVGNKIFAADGKGDVISVADNIAEIELNREYKLMRARRLGFYKEIASPFFN